MRLGQPGALVRAIAEADATAAAKAAAEDFLDAVNGNLLDALLGAEAFAKAVTGDSATLPGPLGWLRELLRQRALLGYAAALDAVDACEQALAAYAQAPLACAVLALELRGGES